MLPFLSVVAKNYLPITIKYKTYVGYMLPRTMPVLSVKVFSIASKKKDEYYVVSLHYQIASILNNCP